MTPSGSGHTLADVALDITVECMDDRGIRHEIDTVLSYAASDPFAVAMTFVTSDGDLVWTFGRDLLIRGTAAPAGDGDVHVSPAVGLSGPTFRLGRTRRRELLPLLHVVAGELEAALGSMPAAPA